MMTEKELSWEAYALDACQSLMDSSMLWTGTEEELKRARTMAGKALELWKKGDAR